jgi:hypothetical protein
MATQNVGEKVLIFHGGDWKEVDMGPFSDPALTAGQKLFAAAALATTGSVAAAEKVLYKRVFGSELGWVSGE